MAMLHNPAGLVLLPTDQVMLNLDTTFHSMCMNPYGYYGWGIYPQENGASISEFGPPDGEAYGTIPLGEICNSAPVVSVPNLAWVFHLMDRLVGAVGFVAPTLVPGLQFGGADGTIAANGGALPTPTRYQLVRQEVPFALNPTASLAFSFSPVLTVGATMQIAMAKVRTYVVSSLTAGTSPEDDMMTELEAEDYFVPAITLSAMLRPTRNLSFVAGFRAVDDFSGPGGLRFTTNIYQQGAVGSEPQPFRNPQIALDRVQVSLPWAMTLAGRFAMPRDGKVDLAAPQQLTTDPLVDELWDVEFDFAYTFGARTSNNSLDIGEDVALQFRTADGAPQTPLVVPHEEIEGLVVNRHVTDSVALRLGGSYNPLPGRLGLSAGGFFESRGIDPAYASLDSFAFARLGLGLGAVLRVGPFDLRVAYQHIFQETVDVLPPPHQPRTAATNDPRSGFDQRIYRDGKLDNEPFVDGSVPDRGDAVAAAQQSALFETDRRRARVINAGRYTASFNVISVGAAYRF